MNPEKALKYVSDTLFFIQAEHKNIDEHILKSVLIYQCLYYNEFHTILSVVYCNRCYYLLFVLLFLDCRMDIQQIYLQLDIHEYRYHNAYNILLDYNV